MSSQIKPPFTLETALAKVKAPQDAWNTRDPEIVAQAYTVDSQWRKRTEFFVGREAAAHRTAILSFPRADVYAPAGQSVRVSARCDRARLDASGAAWSWS